MKPRKKYMLAALAVPLGGIPFLLILAAIVYYCPLSADLIREPLQKSLAQSGLNLDWKSGTIRLSKGSCVLQDVKLEPVGYSGPPLIGRSLEVDYSLEKKPDGKRFELLALRFYEPSRLRIAKVNGGFELSPPLHRFVKKRENAPPLPTIQIKRASVVFGEGEIKQGAFKSVATISNLDFQLSQNANEQLVAAWSGDFSGLHTSQLTGKIIFAADKKSAQLETKIDRINFPMTMKNGQKVATDIHGFSAQGKLDLENNIFTFDGRIESDAHRLQLSMFDFDVTEKKGSVSGKISFSSSEQKLSWNALNFHSEDSDFFTSGSLSFGNGFEFDGNASLTRFHPAWSKLAVPSTHDELARLQIEKDGMIRLDGKLRKFTSDVSLVATGTIILSNLALQTTYLPEPLRHLSGVLYLQNDRVFCDSLTGEYLDNSIQLKLMGDTTFPQGLKGRLRLDVVGDFDVEQLATETIRLVIPERENMAKLDLQGQLNLKGFLETSWPDNPQLADLRWKYDMDLLLQKGRLNHPELPGPVEKIHGDFSVYPDRIEINSLVGESQGIEVHFDGQVKGEHFFWEDSGINASLQCNAQAPQIFDSFKQIKPIKFYEPKGHLSFLVAIKGPFFEPAAWKVDSFLEFKDFQFRSPVRWLLKPISNMNGKLKFNGNSLLIEEDFKFNVGEVTANLKGSIISYDYVDLRVAFEGESSSLDDSIPIFMWRFDVEGFAKGNLRLQARHWQQEGAEAGNKVADLEQMLQAILLDLQSRDLPYEVEMTGALDVDGGTFGVKQMPSPLKNIRGKLNVKNNVLTFKDATCDWGESKNVTGSGQIIIRPDGADVDVDVAADYVLVDEWARKWKPRPQRTSYTLAQTLLLPPEWVKGPLKKPLKKKKQSNININVESKKLSYKQLQGNDYSVLVNFTDYNYTNDRLLIKDGSGDFYYGKLEFDIDLLLGIDGAPSTITMNFKTKDAKLEQLLPVLQKKPGVNAIRGLLTGKLHLQSGLPKFVEELQGNGKIQITQSNLLFDLLGILMNFIPGINNADLNDFTSYIRLQDQTVYIEDFTGILSMVASLQGKGKIGFDKSLLLNIEVGPHAPVDSKNPLNLINKVLKIFKPLHFKVEGTLDKFTVTPQVPFKQERNWLQDGFGKILKFEPVQQNKP